MISLCKSLGKSNNDAVFVVLDVLDVGDILLDNILETVAVFERPIS